MATPSKRKRSTPNSSPNSSNPAPAPASPSTLSLKEQLAEKRKANRARQELTQFLTIAVVVSLVVGMLAAIVGGIKGAVGGFAGSLILLLSFKYPWQALYGFWIYVPLGGTITYAIGGGNNPILQLAKDAFYLPALFAVYQTCKAKRLPFVLPAQVKPILGLLLAYCVMVLLFVNGAQQLMPPVVNSAQQMAPKGERPFLMGVLGLKVFLGYIPLITCAYYFLKTKADFYRLLRITTGLIILCCSLAFVQYMMLKTGRCQGTVGEGAALFKASLEARCLVGGSLLYNEEQGVIRLPGTFVAPWQWGWFLISSAFLSFATAFSDRQFLWRLAGMGAMALTMTMAVLSGQRIALIIVPVVFVLLLFITGQVANLKRFIPIGVALGVFIAIGMALYPDIVQERVDSFVSRWNASPPTEFISDQFSFVSDLSGILGRGLGRATNSARAFGETKLIETYYPKVLYEVGPIGVLLFLAFVTTLTVATFKAYRRVKDKNLRGTGAALWAFVLFISYNTYYYPLDVDPVAVYYWFIAGMILKLPELDQQEDVEPIDPSSLKKSKKKSKKSRAKKSSRKPHAANIQAA